MLSGVAQLRSFSTAGMGWGEDERGRAVDGVDARGENFNRRGVLQIIDGEPHPRALRAANPVALHGDDALGPSPFELLEVIDELVGVSGRFEEPLLEFAGFDEGVFVAPAIAAVDDLLVGEDGATFRAPIDAALFAIGEAALEHAQEKPLVPAVIFGLAGGNFAAPVVAEAEAAQSALEFGDVVVGPDAGMRVVLDGGVFCGETESVPSHGMDDVEAAHALDAGDDVADGVIAHVAHVHGAGRVGQHFQRVILWALQDRLRIQTRGLRPSVFATWLRFPVGRKPPTSPLHSRSTGPAIQISPPRPAIPSWSCAIFWICQLTLLL